MDAKLIAVEFRRIMDWYYGVLFSVPDAISFVEYHPELVKRIEEVGEIETGVRAYMAQLWAEDLGMKGEWPWPTGGDTDQYADIYFYLLGERARSAGYKLRDSCSLWK